MFTGNMPMLNSFFSLIPQYYNDYTEAFDTSRCSILPKHSQFDCKIEFKDNTNLLKTTVTPMSNEEEQELKRHLNEYLGKGFIRQSNSSLNHPIKFRTKKNGEIQLCVDFKRYNKRMIKHSHPIPKITDIYEKVKSATIFTKINIKSAFDAIRIRQGDEFKTAIKTKFGIFEYLVMPQGLPDGPAIFQSFIEGILGNVLNQFVQVYMDDILIYSNDFTQHINHVKNVLKILINYGLVVNLQKSVFHQSEILYLGHMLCWNGIKIDPEKIKIINEWTVPKTVTEIRSFIGYCEFLRKYIDNFASVMKPLYLLTHKNSNLVWNNDCAEAFSKIKYLVANAPMLTRPDREKPFIIQLHSNSIAIWASLSQYGDNNGPLKVIYYCSKLIKESELNYGTYKTEFIAFMHALKEWRHLLQGTKYPIQIYTQDKDLNFMVQFHPNREDLSDFLDSFNFNIIYGSCPSSSSGNSNIAMPKIARIGSVIFKQFNNLYKTNDDYDDVSDDDEDDEDDISDDEESDVDMEDITLKEIRYQYKSDDYAQQIMDDLKYDMDETGYSYNWIIRGGLLIRKNNQDQIYISPSLQRAYIQKKYKENEHNPLSCNKFYDVISSNYWWPGMKQDIKDYYAERIHHQRLKIKKYSSIPWKVVHCEYIYDLKIKSNNNRIISHDATIMIFRDEATNMAHFVGFDSTPTPPLTSQAFLNNVFRLYGRPAHVIIDCPIKSQQWKNLFKLCNCTSSSPNKNEELNKDRIFVHHFLRMVMNKYNNETSWKWILAMAEACYNQYKHPRIKLSPNQALYQYQCNHKHRKGRNIYHFSKYEKGNEIWRVLNHNLDTCKNKIY